MICFYDHLHKYILCVTLHAVTSEQIKYQLNHSGCYTVSDKEYMLLCLDFFYSNVLLHVMA